MCNFDPIETKGAAVRRAKKEEKTAFDIPERPSCQAQWIHSGGRRAQQSSKPARSSHFDSSGIARGTDVDKGFFPLVPNGPIIVSFSS